MKRIHNIHRILIHTVVACAIALSGVSCFLSPSDSENQSTLKRISITSADIFTGDPTTVPGYESRLHRLELSAREQQLTGLAKRAAPIAFAEAKVFVLNSLQSDAYLESIGWDPCVINASKYTAFLGRNLATWEGLLAGMRGYIDGDLIYAGPLERKQRPHQR